MTSQETPQPSPKDRLILTTGAEEEVRILEFRDNHFKEVLDGLGLEVSNPFIEVKISRLAWNDIVKTYLSDDVVHQLIVHDELLAAVWDRRNDFNNHEVTAFSRPPSQRLVSWVNDLKSHRS